LHENEILDESFPVKLFPVLWENQLNCYWINLDEKDPKFGYILSTTMWGDADYQFTSLKSFFNAIIEGYKSKAFYIHKDGYPTINHDLFEKLRKEYINRNN